MEGQEEAKKCQKELLSLREEDNKEVARKEALADERRKADADEMRVHLVTHLAAYDLAQD